MEKWIKLDELYGDLFSELYFLGELSPLILQIMAETTAWII